MFPDIIVIVIIIIIVTVAGDGWVVVAGALHCILQQQQVWYITAPASFLLYALISVTETVHVCWLLCQGYGRAAGECVQGASTSDVSWWMYTIVAATARRRHERRPAITRTCPLWWRHRLRRSLLHYRNQREWRKSLIWSFYRASPLLTTQTAVLGRYPSPPLDYIRVMVIVWRLRGNIIRTAPCWVVWHSVHSQQHTHVSSSYRSSRLGLSHWNPYTVRRGGCLELYYCNMVEWFWWDSSFIWKTNWFPSVLWHCWFGHMTCKKRRRNDL